MITTGVTMMMKMTATGLVVLAMLWVMILVMV